MDTEYSYLYEDKYYENAVKNLKSTFYDVIEREEIMLNNLENRIASETDEGVKARLLELWTKQNDSLDKSIVNFRHIKQSIRVLDSFVKELSEIDEQIVADIINSTNVIRSSRIEQIENDNENVETNDQEVSNNEVVNNEPAVVEKANTDASEQVKENEPEIVKQEVVSEQPVAIVNNEEKIAEKTPQEENVTIPLEKVKEEVPVSESNVPELELVNEENDGMDLPNVVEPEKIDPESMKEEESSQDAELSTEEIDLPFKVEAIPEDEQNVVEDTPVEEQAEENKEESVEENKTEDVSSETTNDQIINNEEVVEETNSDNIVQDNEQPEIQENESNEEPQLVVENVNEEVPLEEGFIDEPVMEDIPADNNNNNNNNNSLEENVTEEVPTEDNNSQKVVEVDSNRIPLRLLKTDLGQPKAIVVNETQYDRLYNSFGKQENKFFERGYLTTDLVANNNYVLGNMFGDIITDDTQTKDDSVQEETVDMEQMLEQANELYKAGRVQEAQELIDKVTEMNRNKELVKAA